MWDDRDGPTALTMEYVSIFDDAADVCAAVEAVSAGEKEEKAYTKLVKKLGKSRKKFTLNLGWHGPWARKLVAQAQEKPGSSLGTLTRTSWIFQGPSRGRGSLGIQTSLEVSLAITKLSSDLNCQQTIGVESLDLFTLSDKFPRPDSSIQSIPVIGKYRVRARVERVFVTGSHLERLEKAAGIAVTQAIPIPKEEPRPRTIKARLPVKEKEDVDPGDDSDEDDYEQDDGDDDDDDDDDDDVSDEDEDEDREEDDEEDVDGAEDTERAGNGQGETAAPRQSSHKRVHSQDDDASYADKRARF